MFPSPSETLPSLGGKAVLQLHEATGQHIIRSTGAGGGARQIRRRSVKKLRSEIVMLTELQFKDTIEL